MNYNEPLNLPQGSVRAILTLSVLAASVILHIIGQGSFEVDGLAATAVGAYFGFRVATTANPTLPPTPPMPVDQPVQVLQTDETDTSPDTAGFVAGE